MKLFATTLLTASLCVAASASAQARTFAINGWGMSSVQFTSDAPLETIVGTTSKAGGSLTVDLGSPAKSAKGSIDVDISSLKTGVDTRDEHLRGEQWFDSGKHPKATFALTKLDVQGAITAGRKSTGTAHGTITIKGKTQKISVELSSIKFVKHKPAFEKMGIKGDVLRITAAFDVKLADFGIGAGLPVIGAKVSDTVNVTMRLTAIAN
ncbi:MAG: polyisoprenoid-binding protein YceI [Myxococcota bacterium]|jgi:polyisoprenoid-binding protein YceI